MRLSDLRDKKVVTEDGKSLGRVHEVHCDGGRVTALKIGPGSLFERLTDRSEGKRIAWECVISIGTKQIVVALDRAKKKPPSGSSGSRTPRRTPQASARRSKR